MTVPAIALDAVRKSYREEARQSIHALDDVTWAIGEGTITGLVGESGSGKTTLIRCVMGLERIDAGEIRVGAHVRRPDDRGRRALLPRTLQLVFQDPTASLNPRMTVGELVGEGLVVHRLRATPQARRERVSELLALVGLDPRDAARHPRSFSGGQRQRIAIARALAVEPAILVCDEPVSSLDVSVQAQVLNLLLDMRDRLGLTILLVAHDLAVIKQVCSEVAVIHHGRIVEAGATSAVLGDPQSPYTQSLLEAVPVPNPGIARENAHRRRTAHVSTIAVPPPNPAFPAA